MDIGGDKIKTRSYAYFPPYTSTKFANFEAAVHFVSQFLGSLLSFLGNVVWVKNYFSVGIWNILSVNQ